MLSQALRVLLFLFRAQANGYLMSLDVSERYTLRAALKSTGHWNSGLICCQNEKRPGGIYIGFYESLAMQALRNSLVLSYQSSLWENHWIGLVYILHQYLWQRFGASVSQFSSLGYYARPGSFAGGLWFSKMIAPESWRCPLLLSSSISSLHSSVVEAFHVRGLHIRPPKSLDLTRSSSRTLPHR